MANVIPYPKSHKFGFLNNKIHIFACTRRDTKIYLEKLNRFLRCLGNTNELERKTTGFALWRNKTGAVMSNAKPLCGWFPCKAALFNPKLRITTKASKLNFRRKPSNVPAWQYIEHIQQQQNSYFQQINIEFPAYWSCLTSKSKMPTVMTTSTIQRIWFYKSATASNEIFYSVPCCLLDFRI